MYIIDMNIGFDKVKAALVMEKHGVDMEAVRTEILEGRFDIDEVRNQDGHPGQRMFVAEDDGNYFLKTAFRNRIYQRRYEDGTLEIPV